MKMWKKLVLAAAGGVLVMVATLARIYGIESHHDSRSSIWWPERGRNLIPPTAIDITLQRDLLDHYATYRLPEADLNAFLNSRFAHGGKPLDSYKDRAPVDPSRIGVELGRLGWVVTKDTVVYEYAASNGGAHTYYHDAVTGRTYQDSAYW